MNHRRALLIAAIVLITLVGLAVRVRHVNHPMRYDESYNYLNFVAYGPGQIATHYLPNNHVLHTLCVWLATKIAGDSPAALRFPAFLCGVLLIPATAALAWSLYGRWSVALLASLAVAASSALIEYSTNARGYSMQALFVVLGAWAAHSAVTDPQTRGRWLLWGALCAAGTYTIPTTVLPALGMIIVIVALALRSADRIARGAMLRGLGMGLGVFSAATLLAYLPFLLVGGAETFAYSHALANNILGQQIGSVPAMIGRMVELWVRHASVLLIVPAVVGAIVFGIQSLRSRCVELALPFGILMAPLLVALLAGAPLPARTWVFAIPVLAIVITAGLCFVGESFFRPSGAGGFLSLPFRRLAPPATNLRPFGADEQRARTKGSNPSERVCVTQFSLRANLAFGLHAIFVIALVESLTNSWKADYLCCEPGGLVLVEPAMKECQTYGTNRCALVAPYTPASAYYYAAGNPSPLVDPSAPDADRVYILTNSNHELDQLWRAGVRGFELYEQPQAAWSRPGGTLYFADRAALNALR